MHAPRNHPIAHRFIDKGPLEGFGKNSCRGYRSGFPDINCAS